jgi:hypothetical protein
MEEEWLHPALALLQSQCRVDRSEITHAASIDYGREWIDGRPQGENALLCLTQGEFPTILQRLARAAVPQ